MFIDSSIPSNYNRIAEISDNYIVLVKENKLLSNHTYNAYVQYFIPSTQVIFIDDYRITTGDSYTYNANYINNGMYSYIDNYSLEFSKNTQELFNTSDDFFERADVTNIFISSGLILVFVFFCINAVTSLVEKGGVFKN